MKIFTCKTCNKEFTKPKHLKHEFKYCSCSCAGKDPEKRKAHSLVMIGKKAWNKGLKGIQSWHNITGFKPGWNKGLTNIYSEEVLENNRQKHLGIVPSNKGMPMSQVQKEKLSKIKTGLKGILCNAYRGGLTTKNNLIRSSLEGKKWKRAVLERDRFTCQDCGKVGGLLDADHIKPFSLYPELRFDLSNGRTLCRECHKKTDTYAGKIYTYKAMGEALKTTTTISKRLEAICVYDGTDWLTSTTNEV